MTKTQHLTLPTFSLWPIPETGDRQPWN